LLILNDQRLQSAHYEAGSFDWFRKQILNSIADSRGGAQQFFILAVPLSIAGAGVGNNDNHD
jgi:hypothetical protein